MRKPVDFSSNCGAQRLVLRPLVPVALALAAGIATGTCLPGHAVAAVVVFFVSAAYTALHVFTRRKAFLWPLLLLAASGYLSIQPWLGRALPDDHVGRYAGQDKWLVGGFVQDMPEGAGQRRHFILQADQLSQGGRPIVVRGKVRVSTNGELDQLQPGARVTVIGRLAEVRGFCNPHGFDYERFMALQGVHARMYAPVDRIRIEAAGQGGRQKRLDGIRRDLQLRMAAALQDFPPAVKQLLGALTLGERAAMDEKLQEAFRRAGVSHVLAISGLHIGMVALAAFALFSRLLVWIPPLLARGWVRKAAAALTLLPVTGYALLAGMSPSTQRALIMAAAFLMTFWIGRPRDWFNALGLAALVILIVTPPALMSISFQLSFAAVLTIVTGMRHLPVPTADFSAPVWRRWIIGVIAFTAVSLLAIWGTTPLTMRYFNHISWVGPLSNLLVVPLVGLLVVPAGLLGIICAPISTLVSGLCWKAAAMALQIIVTVVSTIAAWPLAASMSVTPTLLEMTLFYLFSATLMLWKNRTFRIAGLSIVLLVGTLDAAYWIHRRFMSRNLTVTAVDVGQGSANVLQLPKGYTVLVDGGGFSDNSAFDVGRSVLAPYLWSNKIKTIDLMILTHADSDHLHGLLYILEKFKVHRIWSNHEPAATGGYRRWQELIAEHGIEHLPFERLPLQETLGTVQLEILGPEPEFHQRPKAKSRRDLNNNSLVVRVSLHEVSFLFTGDIKAAAEKELLLRHGADHLRSTIFFVPHHGSKSSSTAAFIEAVQPSESVIAVGWQNRFNFPHPGVLMRLEHASSRIWRTDLSGAVIVRTDGDAYHVQTCRRTFSGDAGRPHENQESE
jgi:competence protein ComEC